MELDIRSLSSTHILPNIILMAQHESRGFKCRSVIVLQVCGVVSCCVAAVETRMFIAMHHGAGSVCYAQLEFKTFTQKLAS